MNGCTVSAGIMFTSGVLALVCGCTAQRENPAKVDEATHESETIAAETQAATPAFPRVDGVYRIKGRRLFGPEEVSVYDYIVFTKGGKVYSINGAYIPPDNYFLEQPSGRLPGEFRMKTVPIEEQPAFILKWIADPDEKQPLSGNYTVKDGAVRFTIKHPGSQSFGPFTWSCKGRATDNGVKMTETSTGGRFAGTNDRAYELVAVE